MELRSIGSNAEDITPSHLELLQAGPSHLTLPLYYSLGEQVGLVYHQIC